MRRWRGRVVIRRSPPRVSPVDRYRIRAVGRSRFLRTRRVRRRGRIVVETRRARLGEGLRLLGIGDGTEVVVTPSQYIDPFTPEFDFEEAAPGTRFVAVEMTIRNVGRGRFDDALDAKLVLANNRALTNVFVSGCDGLVDMAPRETRIGCIAFEVPTDVPIRQFEWSPDGIGQETGVWR